ncbi:MAG: hypothetical protein ABI183_25595 [Polyangiaceae bacterium]
MRTKNVVETKGRVLLAAYFGRADALSQRAMSVRLECAQPSISAWIAGTSRPEAHLREAIEHITGISALAWRTKDEDALVRRIKKG